MADNNNLSNLYDDDGKLIEGRLAIIITKMWKEIGAVVKSIDEVKEFMNSQQKNIDDEFRIIRDQIENNKLELNIMKAMREQTGFVLKRTHIVLGVLYISISIVVSMIGILSG